MSFLRKSVSALADMIRASPDTNEDPNNAANTNYKDYSYSNRNGGSHSYSGTGGSSSTRKRSNNHHKKNNRSVVFVTSGSGVIGYRVAMSLLQAGHASVRVGIWMGDKEHTAVTAAAATTSTLTNHNITPNNNSNNNSKSFDGRIMAVLQSKGAQVVNFDWADESCFESVLEGVAIVFCTIPHMDDWVSVFPSFVQACLYAQVHTFIKISFLRNSAAAERYRENVPFVHFHSTSDDMLIQACTTKAQQGQSNNNNHHNSNNNSMTYTILATSHLMSTPLLHQGSLLRKQHKFVTASYGMGVNYVSPNDVADASVVIIESRLGGGKNQSGSSKSGNDLVQYNKHANKIYNLTGAGPVFDKDVATLLSNAYGTHIEHVSLGYHDYINNIKSRGLPKWLIKDSAAFEKMKASGIDEYASSYTEDLESITGKKPESFADYLENKNSQRPGLTFP